MADMTAVERVTQIFNVIDIDLHGAEIRNSVVAHIRQAEAAAFEAAAQIVDGRWDPSGIAQSIRALKDKSDD